MKLKIIQRGVATMIYTDLKSAAVFVEKSFREGKYSFALMYKSEGNDTDPVLIGIKDLAILSHKGVNSYTGVLEHLGIKEADNTMELDTHYKLAISEYETGQQ